ncbi:MAG: YcjF family protein [Saprospiraceae bacterium]
MAKATQLDGASTEAVLKSTEELKQQADRIVKRHTLYAAGAGLLPFPILDAALLLGIQLTMIGSISKAYHVEFKENLVKSIVGSLVGSIGAASIIKAIPGVGSIIGSVTGAATGGSATYALGKVFTQHFDQGGTLLDFDPVKSREYFKKEFEAGRMFVSDVSDVEEEVAKEKQGFMGNLFTNKKKQ